MTQRELKFRDHRIACGISIYNIANHLKVSSSFISCCETGKEKFSRKQLIEIAMYLKLNLPQLAEIIKLNEKNHEDS